MFQNAILEDQKIMAAEIKFPDIYLQIIFSYIQDHDGDQILYKDLMSKYKMSYPTIRKKINWLIKNKFIRKNGRTIKLVPQFY